MFNKVRSMTTPDVDQLAKTVAVPGFCAKVPMSTTTLFARRVLALKELADKVPSLERRLRDADSVISVGKPANESLTRRVADLEIENSNLKNRAHPELARQLLEKQGALNTSNAKVSELEKKLKSVAVRVDSRDDYRSSDPSAYLYLRRCGLCLRESAEVDDVEYLGPINHKDSCLLAGSSTIAEDTDGGKTQES